MSDVENEVTFQAWQCSNPGCGLRFSVVANQPFNPSCPACKSAMQAVGQPYGRADVPRAVSQAVSAVTLEVMLDNIRSAWNVGAMLRTADGAGVRKVHLVGVTPLPDNPKVSKTALGAEKSLPWQHHPNGVQAAQALIDQGMRLWALEGGTRAEPLFDCLPNAAGEPDTQGAPLVLVVGNELTGVDPGILELCQRVVCLPMQGVKGSLNVAVAFGVAVYAMRWGERTLYV